MYEWMYTCICMSVCVCMYEYLYMYVSICMNMYIYVFVCNNIADVKCEKRWEKVKLNEKKYKRINMYKNEILKSVWKK